MEKLKTDLNRGLRVGTLDIEATGLRADFGYMFCACIKEVNKKDTKGPIHTVRIDDPRNPDKTSDKWVVKETVKLMDSFDLILTWNGSRYDIPFINTRAMKFKLKTPKREFRRDLLFSARANGCLRSNRLVVWDEFLHGRALKTPLNPKVWFAAMRNEKWALDYIVDHCQRDVFVTERIYKRLMPLLGKLKKG